MRLSLTSAQIICLFYAVAFLSTCVIGHGVFFNDSKVKTCCRRTTPGPIKGEILRCTYVPESRRGRCKETYVLTMTNHAKYCIQVDSEWMISKLEELKNSSKPCEGTY
ncbi:hypothetical protein AOLI_G00259190 [Acnodon oligacanthus]